MEKKLTEVVYTLSRTKSVVRIHARRLGSYSLRIFVILYSRLFVTIHVLYTHERYSVIWDKHGNTKQSQFSRHHTTINIQPHTIVIISNERISFSSRVRIHNRFGPAIRLFICCNFLSQNTFVWYTSSAYYLFWRDAQRKNFIEIFQRYWCPWYWTSDANSRHCLLRFWGKCFRGDVFVESNWLAKKLACSEIFIDYLRRFNYYMSAYY